MGPAKKKPYVSSPDDYLLLPEAAARARVSVATVRYWRSQGRLPALRPGKRVLIRRSDLEKFLAGE